ncbi:MAG: rRNA maturation RNAse YbeY [Kiritimatiellae bacterium]|nr:rRNA maturation RNAse YbeY [Kiritimatiellia bacterium]MDD4341126.1 rRNA maturation RNAse YbeY [Kiritimatiellia bacterium]MDY0149367.1 rRNA maturation RNAse YbeY [Kiritimatiellia bacterium]
MKISLLNRQRVLPVRPTKLRFLFRKLVRRAFPADAPLPFAEIVLMLVDDAAMPDYKAGCFGVRQQTDVVTQAYAGIPGVAAPTAEIVVNAQRALVEGQQRPDGPARELALYIAHGLDHLTGADDDTPATRRAMRARETAWLDADPAAWQDILDP